MIKIISSERFNKLKDKVKFLEKEVEHLKGQKQAVLKINEELRNSNSKKEQELRDVYRSKKSN